MIDQRDTNLTTEKMKEKKPYLSEYWNNCTTASSARNDGNNEVMFKLNSICTFQNSNLETCLFDPSPYCF